MTLVNLGDVCAILMGQAPPGESYNLSSNGIPLLAGAGDFGLRYPKPKRFTTDAIRVSKQGDILLCVRATIGQRNWSDRVYCLGRGVAAIRVRSPELDKVYLWHWLGYARPALENRARGSTFKQVTRESVESLSLPLPPLAEQRQIGGILDAGDRIQRRRLESIKLLDELLRSAYLEMFGDPVRNEKGWETSRIGDVSSETQYGTSVRANNHGQGLPVLRMNNITRDGRLDLRDLKSCDISERDLNKYTVRRGDLLFNRTNSPELVGKTAVWDRDEAYSFAGYLVRVRFDQERVLPEYVSAYLNSAFGKNLLFRKAKPSINMSNISPTELKRLPIPIPPLDVQLKYIAMAATTKLARRDIESAIAIGDSLFQSLLLQIFR